MRASWVDWKLPPRLAVVMTLNIRRAAGMCLVRPLFAPPHARRWPPRRRRNPTPGYHATSLALVMSRTSAGSGRHTSGPQSDTEGKPPARADPATGGRPSEPRRSLVSGRRDHGRRERAGEPRALPGDECPVPDASLPLRSPHPTALRTGDHASILRQPVVPSGA